MLQHADQDEAPLIKFCLSSGFRDREIRYRDLARCRLRTRWCASPRKMRLEIQAEELRRRKSYCPCQQP